MNNEDIIRIAKDAWCGWTQNGTEPMLLGERQIKRFAALVAAQKEAQMIRDGYRQCAEGQRTTQYCGLLAAAVKAEREACAKVCDGWMHANGDDCAEAIRARGEA
jgi:hypothetical protein